jgi:signal transduction histidine kinase
MMNRAREQLVDLEVTDADPADPFRLIGRIAAGVAHDLNNYLTVLEVALPLLRRRHHDDLLWSQAHDAVGSATRLIHSLLEYARGAVPVRAAVDLGALVRRTLAMIACQIPSSVVVVVDAREDLPAVYGVASELEQVVLNLVLNACDAMPAGGELRISVGPVDTTHVSLDVADTGTWLATGAMIGPLSRSTKPGRNGGGGLGLGIVRAVADRHDANLTIVSVPDGGTRIGLTLGVWPVTPS